jgi:sortase A
MTLVRTPPAGAASGPGGGAATGQGATGQGATGQSPSAPAQRQQPPAGPAALVRQVVASTVMIVAVCLLGFALWLPFGSRLQYDRFQHDAYANFRVTLAQGIAPTGHYQPANAKQLLPLGTPVALLNIPEIGLNAVVLEGTNGSVLQDGPGLLRDTQLPGQAGVSYILGRRAAYGGPFSGLSGLSPGDTFTVTTGEAPNPARYRVLDVRRAGDLNPPVAPGQGRLVLETADGPPFAPSGELWVDADLISAPTPTSAALPYSALSPSELAMGIEPLAWVPLVLWGQCLLLAVFALSFIRSRWGRWQTWIIAVPVLAYIGISVADQVTRLLPNLM